MENFRLNIFGPLTYISVGGVFFREKYEKREKAAEKLFVRGSNPPERASQRVPEVHTRFLVAKELYSIIVGKEISPRIF